MLWFGRHGAVVGVSAMKTKSPLTSLPKHPNDPVLDPCCFAQDGALMIPVNLCCSETMFLQARFSLEEL